MLRFGFFECGLRLGGRQIATLPHPSRRCRILRFLGGALGEKIAVSAHAAKATFIDGRDGLVEESQSEV
jgi:hypothetical protein